MWVRNTYDPTNPYSNDNIFLFRKNQYMWKNADGEKKFCGPETYLDSTGVYCVKNPKYYDYSTENLNCYPNIDNIHCSEFGNNLLANIMSCCYL